MPRVGRFRIREARAALEKLMDDPEQTELVFVIVEALAGRQPERLQRRIRRAPGGERLLRERPEFDPNTCDLEQLGALPPGSFGHEFARWMRKNDFQPGLMDRESTTGNPELAYLGKRLTQVHDFWHVLSGYNRDPVGELGVLGFSYGQTGSHGIGFILLHIAARSLREHWKSERRPWSPLLPYLWRAFRAGRRATFLPPLELEALFGLPLESVRALLGIQPLRHSLAADALPPIAAPIVH